MSYWTYIKGTVTVEPPGHGQRAKDFVLGSVIDHLPRVTGSEGPMHVEIVRHADSNCSSNHDELGQFSNLGNSFSGHWFECQGTYELVVYASLRDRLFEQTLREFVKWLTRLSKRVNVDDILVRVSGQGKSFLFDDELWLEDNFEEWSWAANRDPSKHWRLQPNFLDAYESRRSMSYRYPTPHLDGNWVERLGSALPGARDSMSELDYLMGNLEPYEYDCGPDGYAEDVAGAVDRMRRSLVNLVQYEEWLRKDHDYDPLPMDKAKEILKGLGIEVES